MIIGFCIHSAEKSIWHILQLWDRVAQADPLAPFPPHRLDLHLPLPCPEDHLRNLPGFLWLLVFFYGYRWFLMVIIGSLWLSVLFFRVICVFFYGFLSKFKSRRSSLEFTRRRSQEGSAPSKLSAWSMKWAERHWLGPSGTPTLPTSSTSTGLTRCIPSENLRIAVLLNIIPCGQKCCDPRCASTWEEYVPTSRWPPWEGTGGN